MDPLSTFASKIDLAFALEIIAPEIHKELKKIKKILDSFAHSRKSLSLDQEPLKPLFDSLKLPPGAKGSYVEVLLDCVVAIDDHLEKFLLLNLTLRNDNDFPIEFLANHAGELTGTKLHPALHQFYFASSEGFQCGSGFGLFMGRRWSHVVGKKAAIIDKAFTGFTYSKP
jgi:hypothetical protein